MMGPEATSESVTLTLTEPLPHRPPVLPSLSAGCENGRGMDAPETQMEVPVINNKSPGQEMTRPSNDPRNALCHQSI